jgi:hypothetical protein
MADAARDLGTAQKTFHRWARGYERAGPLLHIDFAEHQRQFGREYVLVSRELATDGITVPWDYARTETGTVLHQLLAQCLEDIIG